MTKKNIHKKIVRNLLIGGLFISIIVGLSVFIIEQHRIDDYVANLALQESSKYSGYYVNYYGNPTPANLTLLRKSLQASLNHERFIRIDIFDDNLTKIITQKVDDFDQLQIDAAKNFPAFVMKGKAEYLKTSVDGQQYVKVMLPISASGNDKVTGHFSHMFDTMQKGNAINVKSNQIIGHFVGIYHVGEQLLAKIKKQILLSVGYAILIVILTTCLIYPIILQLSDKLSQLSFDLLESNINTIKSLGSAIAKRDSDTNAHNYRVTIYSVKLAEKLNLSHQQIRALIKGAFLHDIGKIGIPDSILCKPGKLTAHEFSTMKQHVELGMDIIRENQWLIDAVDVVRYHHEKYDGNGYTQGLKGDDIPLNARIFAIADVFDALTSERPYKAAFSYEKSLNIIKNGSGSHFDPSLVNEFEQVAETVYQSISHLENELALSQQLDALINRYFSILDSSVLGA